MIDLEQLEAFLSAEDRSRLLILGGADKGKSHLIETLAAHLSHCGLRVAMVDADPGQSRIGPPTTVGLQYPCNPDRGADALWFVGSVSPPGHLLPMLSGLIVLTHRAETAGADLVLIDTPGFMDGPAAGALWQNVIDVLRPAVVLLERPADVRPRWLSAVSPLLALRASSAAITRTSAQRQVYRAEGFRRYFESGLELCLDTQSTAVRWVSGSGEREVDLQAGQLVGLRGAEGFDVGLGIVVDHDSDGGRVRLKSAAIDPADVSAIIASRLQIVADDWRERRLVQPVRAVDR
jgi:polynucleotide 5'-hydroxyl-kinase GRC3/NOL9